MAVTIGTNTITGISLGGLPDGSIANQDMGYAGAPLQVVSVRSRTQASYTAPNSGNGGNIAVLNMTLTPKKAGNLIVLEYMVHSECNSYDIVYTITRNDVLLANSTNGTNRWSGIATNHYDRDYSSTPVIDAITFVDTNSLSVSTTYKLLVRSSNSSARTYRLNRPYNSAGTDSYEAGVSVVVATEINT